MIYHLSNPNFIELRDHNFEDHFRDNLICYFFFMAIDFFNIDAIILIITIVYLIHNSLIQNLNK